jgi:hypothetical protein
MLLGGRASGATGAEKGKAARWRGASGAVGDRDGAVAVIAALMLPILVGSMALGVDIAFWRYRASILQTSADAAAVAVMYDIQYKQAANGGSIPTDSGTASYLQAEATQEVYRNCNGQGGACSLASFTWPYQSSYGQVQLVAQDSSVHRFFSFLYSSTQRTLQATASAKQGSETTTTTTTTTTPAQPDDGCLMTLGGGILFQNGPSGVPGNCTVIADGGSITLESGPNVWINGTAYQTGAYVAPQNMNGAGGFGGTVLSNQTAIADPYSGYITGLTSAQFPSGSNGGSASSTSTPCNDAYSGSNLQVLTLGSGDTASNNAALSDSATASPYTGGYNQDKVGHVNAQHPFKGAVWQASTSSWYIGGSANGPTNGVATGGGRWCLGWTLSNTTLNLGPGTYVIEGQLNASNATINATQGTTIVLANVNNLNWGGSAFTLNLVAPGAGTPQPTGGPSANLATGIAGLALTQVPGTTIGNFNFNNGFGMFAQGDVYLPSADLKIQSMSAIGWLDAASFSGSTVSGAATPINTSSQPSSNATSQSAGCSRVIVHSFTSGSTTTIGSDPYRAQGASLGDGCTNGMGVKPFGTSKGAGGVGGWSGGTSTTTTTTTTAYPKING